MADECEGGAPVTVLTLGVPVPEGATWTAVPGDLPVDEAYARVTAVLDGHGQDGIVLLTPTARGSARSSSALGAVERHGRLLKALTTDERVAVVSVPGPTTRLVVLAKVLHERFGHLPAAEVQALARALHDGITSRAVVTSVAKLAEPSPSLVQHIVSAWPWSRYNVEFGGKVASSTTSWEPVEPVTAVSFARKLDVEPGTIAPGVTDVSRLAADAPDTHNHWGSPRFSEISVATTEVDRIAVRVAAEPPVSCSVCEREIRNAALCPFCGVVLPEHSSPSPARPVRLPQSHVQEVSA